MARKNINLLELNIDKLFEEHSIDEILELEKLLDAEYERKRIELRSMVGDRYKDILAASDAIKTMKNISEDIVNNIEKITATCHDLISGPVKIETKYDIALTKQKIEERTIIIQIRLAIFLNEQIWIALDEGNNLNAAQFFLLAQHIHTGLSLVNVAYLSRIPLLQQTKDNLNFLKSKILQKITEQLESVQITADETSDNLNALILLQNQSSSELLTIFIEHRKTALNTVINSPHSGVRYQVSAMVRCLITTVHLLHDCFISSKNSARGLIWTELENITSEFSKPTLEKIELPITPLVAYIPDIIKHFRPKCKTFIDESTPSQTKSLLENWLISTQESVRKGLENPLEMITNVKGLHIIREESLKIESPDNWEKICEESNLPENFNIWYFFFQGLISNRAKSLITSKIASNISHVQKDIFTQKFVNLNESDMDLRSYSWCEQNSDVKKTENNHIGLTMKTKGYTPNIVKLCETMDSKYLELLEDVYLYLYRKEFESLQSTVSVSFKDYNNKKEYIDKEDLENHLQLESTKTSYQLTKYIENILEKEEDPLQLVLKSVMCARFLRAIPQLCLHFHKCCTFNGNTEEWSKNCNNFSKTSLQLWQHWLDHCTEKVLVGLEKQLGDIQPQNIMNILAKWDTIEIQEQAEEKVFKSQIKVPLKPSLALLNILNNLNNNLSFVLPHTLPKSIHQEFIEKNVRKILDEYSKITSENLNQIQALQFLFDVKFLTTFCISRENIQLVSKSQEICDRLRDKIDPFDLDVFYSYLQSNVKRAVGQSQVILGCLLPSPVQLASLGVSEKNKEQEKDPSILALSIPSTTAWFPLLPITAPLQKTNLSTVSIPRETKVTTKSVRTVKKSQDPTAGVRSSAASLFGGLTTDWFS